MLQSVTGPHVRGDGRIRGGSRAPGHGLDGHAALARPERRTPARPMWE
jgi:hypothetical protein